MSILGSTFMVVHNNNKKYFFDEDNLKEVVGLLEQMKSFREAELEARPDVFEGSSDALQDYANQIALLELCEKAGDLYREVLDDDDDDEPVHPK